MQTELLIICPNSTKINILEEINNNRKIIKIKFMELADFISNYFYSYDNKAISYIMDEYNINISVRQVEQ